MNCYIVIIVLCVFLQGCSSNMFHSDHYSSRFSQYGYGYVPIEDPMMQKLGTSVTSVKILEKYATRIANELAKQVNVDEMSQVGVASFVDLDDNLQSSHALGNKLAEALIIALHEVGFSITEINLTGGIKVTDSGNFIFSRIEQSQKFSPLMVSGIISYTQYGININSRLIQTNNSDILAANSLFMPNFLYTKAFPSVEGTDLIIKNQ
jgi:TolB-like protein